MNRVKASDLVGTIVAASEKYHTALTPLRLQAMLFFIQKESLWRRFVPAFDDDICAWDFGPIVPDVYYEYSCYASTPIINVKEKEIDEKLKDIVNCVVCRYSGIATWRLIDAMIRDKAYVRAREQGNSIVRLEEAL
jgi:uncharacterized phage-associated protein